MLSSLFMIMASNMGPSRITNSIIRLIRHSCVRSVGMQTLMEER